MTLSRRFSMFELMGNVLVFLELFLLKVILDTSFLSFLHPQLHALFFTPPFIISLLFLKNINIVEFRYYSFSLLFSKSEPSAFLLFCHFFELFIFFLFFYLSRRSCSFVERYSSTMKSLSSWLTFWPKNISFLVSKSMSSSPLGLLVGLPPSSSTVI